VPSKPSEIVYSQGMIAEFSEKDEAECRAQFCRLRLIGDLISGNCTIIFLCNYFLPPSHCVFTMRFRFSLLELQNVRIRVHWYSNLCTEAIARKAIGFTSGVLPQYG